MTAIRSILGLDLEPIYMPDTVRTFINATGNIVH